MLRSHFLAPVVAAIFLLPSLAAASGACLNGTCHSAVLTAKRPHSPVKEGDCLSCHKQTTPKHPTPGGKGFALVAPGGKLCAGCHELPGAGTVEHPPSRDGDCIDCHQPHGADGRFLLKNSDNLSGLCFGCHDSAPFNRKYTHGPAGAGACAACHNPHRAAGKSLLGRPVNEGCLVCHKDLAGALSTAPFVHAPVKVAVCTSCHDPHSSDTPVLLKTKMPELCYECHKTLQSRLAKIASLHKPLTQPGSCGKCHAPHASQGRRLMPTDEKELCLGCHGVDNLGAPPLKNIRKVLAGKKFLHGPIQAGKCTGCHDPHGTDSFRLLTGPYPATLYAPYRQGIYDFCLKCHEKNLLKFAESSIYTGFRNGKRNLHYVHVVNDRKGRTCRICHDPHASNGEKLINTEGYRFGEWNIPINYKATPTGGSCAPGCHKMFAYDREKPESYR